MEREDKKCYIQKRYLWNVELSTIKSERVISLCIRCSCKVVIFWVICDRSSWKLGSIHHRHHHHLETLGATTVVVSHKCYMHFIGTGFTYLHHKSEMEKIVDAQTRTGTANCFLFIVVDKVSNLA